MTSDEFHTLYQGVQPYLRSFAMRLTANEADAQDLMQETLARAFAQKNQFCLGTNFRAWTTAIMRNFFIAEYRKNKARKNKPIHAFNHTCNEAPSNLMLQELQGMLEALSDIQRISFDLFYNGFTYDEIAKKLKVPIGSVKSRIFFARRKLKKMIMKNYGESHLLTA
jgi:RNA polymerase sigma-70 factor (ECF subfamily)